MHVGLNLHKIAVMAAECSLLLGWAAHTLNLPQLHWLLLT